MPGTILLVDDVATNRLRARVKLAASYYDVIEAESGEAALALAKSAQPDLVLLDVMMPGLDGFETCRRLKESPDTMHIPVVILTALDGQQCRLQGLDAGADDFLTKPYPDITLFNRVSSLIRMKLMIDELRLRHETSRFLGLEVSAPEAQPRLEGSSVLFVTRRDELAAEAAREIRARLGCAIENAEGEAAARALIDSNRYDTCLIGPRLADGEPMRVAALFRARAETRQTPVMMIFPADRLSEAHTALEMGVADYVSFPPDVAELTARLRIQLRRKHYSDRLRSAMDDSLALATTDSLTGLYNRRYARSHLDLMIARQQASGRCLAAMVLDLDHFKAINDSHGHAAGDTVLCEFARRLRDSVRGVDLVARIGGEEFLVVMPDIPRARAAKVAERVRCAVERAAFHPQGSNAPLSLTVSIGLAFYEPGELAAGLLERADAALYASKKAGRNLVTLGAAA
ncbi:MAG TPA: PleD family two-component system response regulator [Thermohalobaculum sp.]|nr:PleD family two-component system response regulator [Thermohalobaculum sp.]